jgi:hypothetical protein
MLFVLLLSSCQSNQKSKQSQELSSEEREWMIDFFNDIMFFQNSIYTLWGAHKAITEIPISNYSEEEMKAIYESHGKKDKIKAGFSLDVRKGYVLSEAWKKWEEICHRFPMKRFIFFKIESEDPHIFFVYFVDKVKTAALVQENYEAFQKVMGYDFHPMELILEMDKKDFWDKLNSYHYGLLFGFGKTNSQMFHWKYFDHPKSCDEFCKDIKFSFSNEQLKGSIKFSIDYFLIPAFASFNNLDPVIDSYKNEREKIKEVYKGKDFLDITLQKLTE